MRSTSTGSRAGRYARAPVATLNAPESARWFNFGLWHPGDGFAQACERLARTVGDAARIAEGDSVLDVGCGHAETAHLWLRAYAARRVYAVELERVALAAARRRFGDAVGAGRLVPVVARAEQLPLRAASCDRVVAVDAAYHFQPRRRFLLEAQRCLRPGGRLAVADLLLARPLHSAITRPLWGALASVAGVPAANLIDADAYTALLHDCGFHAVDTTFVGDQVLPGFAAFVRARRRGAGRELSGPWLAAEALAALHARGAVRYAVIAAERRA